MILFMTEQNKKRRELSKYKDCFCVYCYEELALSLEYRRGETDIECSECKKSFSIDEAEKFIKSLSPIISGRCPSCNASLYFCAENRIEGNKIICPKCKGRFYIDEAEKPMMQTTINCNFCGEEMSVSTADLYRTTKAFPKFRCNSCGKIFYKQGLLAEKDFIKKDDIDVKFKTERNSATGNFSQNNIQPYNSTAILAFILSLFLPIIPLFLGLSALNEIKRTKERGEGLATFAVVLGILQIFIYLALFAMAL